MNRKLKALGLALAAVCAMSALSAATASAFPAHIGASHGTLVGINVGEEVFTTRAGTVKCKTARYEGTFGSSTPLTQRVKPSYEGCTAFGFVSTPIDVGTCEFEFATSSGFTSLVNIVNCGATPITVTAFNCWVTVGNQNGLSHVVWSNNNNNPHDIHATSTITGIHYTQHSKSFPGCESGTTTNGTYSGTNRIRAFDTNGAQVPITAT